MYYRASKGSENEGNMKYMHKVHCSVSPGCLKDTQDVQKQVDKVQIEVNGCHDVLLCRELVHDHVCIKDYKSTEYQSTSYHQHKLQCLAPEKHLCVCVCVCVNTLIRTNDTPYSPE